MYFWKTDQLAADIKNNKVSEKSKMYYYLLIMASYNIVTYQYLADFTVDTTIAIIEMVVTTLIVIIGTLITFKTNKGEDGVDYVSGAIMLGLPISIKLVVFASIFQIALFEFVFYYWDYDVLTDSFLLAMLTVITVLFFWRLNEHLKFINNEVH